MKLTDYPPIAHAVLARQMTVADMLCIVASDLYLTEDTFDGIRLVNIANGTVEEYDGVGYMIADPEWSGMRKVEVLYRHAYQELGSTEQYYICVYDQIDEEEDDDGDSQDDD